MGVLMLQEWVEHINIILSLVLTDPSVTSPCAFGRALTKAKIVVAESTSLILLIDSVNIKFGVSPCWDSFFFQLVVSSAVIQVLVNKQVAEQKLSFVVANVCGEWWEGLSPFIQGKVVRIEGVNGNENETGFCSVMNYSLNGFLWCRWVLVLSLDIFSLHIAHTP